MFEDIIGRLNGLASRISGESRPNPDDDAELVRNAADEIDRLRGVEGELGSGRLAREIEIHGKLLDALEEAIFEYRCRFLSAEEALREFNATSGIGGREGAVIGRIKVLNNARATARSSVRGIIARSIEANP